MIYNGRVHIWIKQEDRELWDAIEDVPTWVHEHLNGYLILDIPEKKDKDDEN